MSYGLPYQGSKRKIAKALVGYMIENNPGVEYVYDLFGGGGAMSFEFIQRPQIKRVYYNELNTGVTELLKDIIANGVTEKYYKWVDRETFHKHIKDNDWFGGLLKTCWSFGNNQRGYIFGREVEPLKKAAHEYLLKNGYDRTVKTRKPLLNEFKEKEKIAGRFDLQQLEQLQQLERIERLERLQQLERLVIYNKSYDAVKIETPPDKTIIYLDPPYENTSGYQKTIDHAALFEWVKNSPYKIYMSEYAAPFPSVFEIKKRVLSTGAAGNGQHAIEKLFCNREETATLRKPRTVAPVQLCLDFCTN